jgi:DNA-binding NarL/FixJ family response regulator
MIIRRDSVERLIAVWGGRKSGIVDFHVVGPAAVREDAPVRAGVLIVDDHAEFREAARTMLEAAGFDVVGEARDGAEALASEPRLRPAVVLLDIQLPDIDGFAVAESLAALADPPVVVLTSSRDAAAYGDRVRGSPARGYIAKFHLSGLALADMIR